MKCLLMIIMVAAASAKQGGLKSTSSLCKTSCNGVTKFIACTVSCKGVDSQLCRTADWDLCKAGCLGIKKCVHKCEDAIIKPCVKILVDQCDDRCAKAIVGPCEEQCEKQGLPICEKGVKAAGTYGCTQLCITAATAAIAAGGGPEDPGADAVAAVISSTCGAACTAAIKKGEVPGTDKFAEDVCMKMGFVKPPAVAFPALA